METQQQDVQPVIVIRPAAIFAFIKIFGLLIAAAGFLYLAWRYFPPADLAQYGHYSFCRLPLCLYPQDTVHHHPRIFTGKERAFFSGDRYD